MKILSEEHAFEVAKIAIPVFLGTVVWGCQALAQRAWTEYERRRELYLEIVRSIDALFDIGTQDTRIRFHRAIRSVWIGGSDDVIQAANRLIESTNNRKLHLDQKDAYQDFILRMRIDLQKRRWLPPQKTQLDKNIFELISDKNNIFP